MRSRFRTYVAPPPLGLPLSPNSSITEGSFRVMWRGMVTLCANGAIIVRCAEGSALRRTLGRHPVVNHELAHGRRLIGSSALLKALSAGHLCCSEGSRDEKMPSWRWTEKKALVRGAASNIWCLLLGGGPPLLVRHARRANGCIATTYPTQAHGLAMWWVPSSHRHARIVNCTAKCAHCDLTVVPAGVTVETFE